MHNSITQWHLSNIAQAMHGQLIGDDSVVRGVSIDSRSIGKDELFVAITGDNFNGHDFAHHAVQRGAVGIVVKESLDIDIPQIIVSDTRQALGNLAHAWRMQFDIPVIGITGSNGKTTVKEMVAAIVRCEQQALSTLGNLNNDIGVPLTLLRLSDTDQAAVIEMGANHHNEIQYLTNLVRPSVALITNAGPAHLEGFGSLDGVAQAKGEIYSGLLPDGIAVINADDPRSNVWYELCEGKNIVSFAVEKTADVQGRYLDEAQGLIHIDTPQGGVELNLPLPGKHNLMNALAATAACISAGVSLTSVKTGLEGIKSIAGRFELKRGKTGSRIIDDTYNANPASFKAALDVLHAYPGRHFVALGDMGELGEETEELHRDVGKQAKEAGVNNLYAIGKYAQYITQSFGEHAYAFVDHQKMILALRDDLGSDVTLLVKGSRLMQMEKIVNALVANGD